ncbi:hypothetical protein HOR54_gp36 [Vibrio phage Vp670]|uniref:DUF7768 domain-containing protein n=3 Tax=Kaohsiungvirus TaxID=2731674 RepID=A0A067YIS5_9CAUD|nr:hypothetical protein RJ80_gp22 [Vibrio phage phi-A318]YP_009783886.1 hypothetical protein HOQ87_gp18 [Vibrio phage AS51]YP_009788842.1 hypothetical protein HOR54_gp36 [Vibrio phage Vp670]AGZ17749.1 hypothetical protein [Vibrio phage phi-A318]AHC94062.1 hypothetical protein [Vibrio phage AS51]APU00173.1 hypothetical protein QD07_36 [Vibrio phage Vp670]
MKPVIIESPFKASSKYSEEAHVEYAQRCMHDALLRGEAPYASHLLYTQPNVLDDSVPEERKLGIEAGFAWKHQAGVLTVFYTDCGWSQGMRMAHTYCIANNLPYEIRSLHA